MPLAASQETRSWLQERGLGGYLKVIDAPAHPDAQAVARRIHPDTVTNNMIRAALDLKRGGDHEVEIPPSTTLKEYFGAYSISGKAYRTYGGSNKAFGELARILMEYAFVHTNPTSMPQSKAAIIISAYEGNKIDWGIITGEGIRAALESFQTGKRLLPVINHFLTVLYPPPSVSPRRILTSPPPPRKQREKILEITQEEWEDSSSSPPPSGVRNPASASAPPPPKTQRQRAVTATRVEWDEAEEAIPEDVTIRQRPPRTSMTSPQPSPRPTSQQPSAIRQQKRKQAEEPTPPAPDAQDQPPKRSCIIREATTETEGDQRQKSKEASPTSTDIVPTESWLQVGTIEHGQTTQISEEEVLGYKDLPVEAYEFSALLRLGTTYELMDFLARAQVAAATRMAEEHAETKMIQRALMGEIEPHEDRALQKIGRKKQVQNASLLMELPDLNMALVEAYRNLHHTTRAAKDMARRIKTAHQQAKRATDLWQAAEEKLATLTQQQPPLILPAPSDVVSPATLPNPSPSAEGTDAHKDDTAHPRVATVDASTMTNLVQASEPSSRADISLHPQTSHASTQTPPPPEVMERATQTDRESSAQLQQAATQTGPPLRDYQEELQAQIALAEMAEQNHNNILGQQREQAASREANLKRLLAKRSAALEAREREVMTLQVSITEAKERFIKETERNSQREQELFADNQELRRHQRAFQDMANEHMQKWRISEEQRAKISDAYHQLQSEHIAVKEQHRDAWRQERDETVAQLTNRYEQTIALITEKAKDNQATLALFARKSQAEAKAAREALEVHRASIGMDDTKIKTLIHKYRQQFTTKIKETLDHVWQEWSAQAADLHILRADAENRRKEGRGFYKMDDTSIQTLREDLTEEYHTLATSHTAAIEQLLEEFNDDLMVFRLEAEAYEEERLATGSHRAPTNTEQGTESLPTAARPEESAPTDVHIPPEPQTITPTLPESVPTEEGTHDDTAIPNSATQPPSPTPPAEQPAQPHAPEDILGILEEE